MIDNINYQTRPDVAEYMASLLPKVPYRQCILEPTPGAGNLVAAAKKYGDVIAPVLFENLNKQLRFDCAIMNPPFSPMALGYQYLLDVMLMTDEIVALLPWFIYINSDKRSRFFHEYGLILVTHLPRNVFPGCRIQCCIFKFSKGYMGITTLNNYTKSFNL